MPVTEDGDVKFKLGVFVIEPGRFQINDVEGGRLRRLAGLQQPLEIFLIDFHGVS